MADVSGLRDEVARDKTVMGSAAALIRGFQAKLDAAIQEAIKANDDADLTALTELSDSLEASADDLAAAVSENTPASGNEPTPGGGSTEGPGA